MPQKRKILWIEDGAYQLRGLVKPLEKRGYRIEYALNAKEAIEKLNREDYQLILLDIIIPTGDDSNLDDLELIEFVGLRLADKIVNEMKINTPIIGITVVNNPRVIDHLYDLGVMKIFFKGYLLPSQLLDYIENFLAIYDRKNQGNG
jgi:CheY-like chemotaxis protein